MRRFQAGALCVLLVGLFAGSVGIGLRKPVPSVQAASSRVAVWVTFYAAYDNDPAGSRDIAYPGPVPRHQLATEGTGAYNNPITVASDRRWLPVGVRIYVVRFHKYYIMEDECAECEHDWRVHHFRHVDLYMSNSVRRAVLVCEDKATKDRGLNDTIIVNPPSNLPVDPRHLYTDTHGCTLHEYSS